MIVTIHQAEHLPWLGFFDKLSRADLWVNLDHVQYRKNYFQNRNRIRGSGGPLWVTVPVLTKGCPNQPINQVRINNGGSRRWKEKAWASLVQHYRKARYWSDHQQFFESLYDGDWERLVDINEAIIQYLLVSLSINVETVKSSELDVCGTKETQLLNLCRQLGADVYLSGVSGRDYLDLEPFDDAGIEVRFQEFHHPVYQQAYEPFIPCMSAVDLLLNYGPDSLDVIKGIGVETMEEVYE